MKYYISSLFLLLSVIASPTNSFGQAPNLGTTADFVLFSTVGAIGNTGISQLTGHVGTNNGSSTGFGNINGNMNDGNGVSAQAATDLLALYNNLNGATANFFIAPALGNGSTLVAGVYDISAASTLNNELILDGQNNPNAIFIFKISGSLSVGSNAKVKLINGAQACNVFWKIEGLVSISTGVFMRGNIIANNAAISMSSNDTLEGRALSIAGAISIDNFFGYIPKGCGRPILTGPTAPNLGSAACFALLTNDGELTNAGISNTTGDVGTNTGLTTGFNPLNVIGQVHPIPNSITAAAAADLGIAHTYINSLPANIELLYPAQFGSGLVLTANTYVMNGAVNFVDTVYLHAHGNANAVFVIKVYGAFSAASHSSVVLLGGAQAKNVYWLVGGAVELNDYANFIGTIICNNGAIDLKTGANIQGRALTTVGALTTAAVTVRIPTSCMPPVPANDNCTGATLLTQTTTCTPTTGTVAGATQSLAGCTGDAEDDVWYSFVATGTSAVITVAASASFDAVFEVRSGACAAGTSLRCTDNTASGSVETATLTTLTIGQTYFVRVYDYYATAPATTTFTICVTSPTAAPANDNCAGAFNLATAATCTPLTGTVAAATQSLAGCQGTAGDDVWFRFTATTPSINLTVAGSSSFDAVVQVFSGTCAALTSINCTDNDADRGGTEVANLSGLTVGQTYFVRVYDYYTPAPATPTFTICAQAFTQCNLTAPIGAILEGEACGDSTNNGCANVAPTYGNISCGQTVFGNAWANAGSRDLDYYRFTVAAGDTVRWNVNAEFPALIAIARIPLNNCDSLVIVNSAAAPACTPTNLTTFLAAGTYYAIVVPSVFTGYACGTNNDYIASFSVGTPNTIATTTIAASCAVGGSATANVSGSAAPYTYLWSNSRTTQTTTGLMAGTYMVTATNANSCRVMATATVASSAITVTATPSSTPTTCGVGTGTATIAPTNGVAPYTYLWSGARTGSTITGLVSGSYNVTITDANGCMGIVNAINVANPSAPTATISSTNIACFGNNTGTANINVVGGTTPYTFSWSNSSSITNTASALAAGSFSATINDANNCAAVVSGDVLQPTAALAVTAAVSSNYNGAQISCFAGSNGQAQATSTGGTGVATYIWSNSTTMAIANNLAAGAYSVTATDANGCTAMAMTTLTAPAAVSITVTSTNGDCQGQAGMAVATATGGTSVFITYGWSNGAATSTISNLNAGMYTATATDANGCIATDMATITGGAGITSAMVIGTDASATAAADGTANLTITDGLAPFTYAWSNGATTEDISGLAAGTYTVTITDDNGCTANANVTISQPVGVINATAEAMSLRLFPNPAQQTATLELSLLSASQVNIEIYNVTGQVLFSQNAEQIGTQQYQIPVADFAQGVYFIKVRAANNTATQRLIISRD